MVKVTEKVVPASQQTCYIRIDVDFRVDTNVNTGDKVLFIELPVVEVNVEEHWIAIEKAYGLTYAEGEELAIQARRVMVSKFIASKMRL